MSPLQSELSHPDKNGESSWPYAVELFATKGGILDLFSQETIHAALAEPHAATFDVSPAVTSLVLATGAQCRGTGVNDAQISADMFCRARSIAFASMLSDPSTTMIAEFLLMAFYLLGACHRNAAFMYLGVANKPHVFWTGIVNLVWPVIQPGKERATVSHPYKRSMIFCPYLDELASGNPSQSISSTEQFLQRLRQWSASLPESLRNWKRSETSACFREDSATARHISRTHLACVYYFTIILVTRQHFTNHLLLQLRRDSSGKSTYKSKEHNEGAYSPSLAHVCLDAAINLVKPYGSDPEVESTFFQACAIEQRLAALSPQAEQYHEILKSFGEATLVYQQRRVDCGNESQANTWIKSSTAKMRNGTHPR
ncbi:hypothetical protein U1Q18_052148 [Sarracenia purpurea var. burkii]